jgi:hypothetical protein
MNPAGFLYLISGFCARRPDGPSFVHQLAISFAACGFEELK